MFQKEQIKIINMASSYCDTLNGYLIRLAIKLAKTKYAEENYCGVILQSNKYFFCSGASQISTYQVPQKIEEEKITILQTY